jgi:hypothetical protein
MGSGGLDIDDSLEGMRVDLLKMSAGLNSIMEVYCTRKTIGDNKGQKEEEPKTEYVPWNVADAEIHEVQGWQKRGAEFE